MGVFKFFFGLGFMLVKSFYQKYRMGILVGTAWGAMLVIGYEFTKAML